MNKYEFKVAWCGLCEQGWIEIVKSKENNHLYLQCSECCNEFKDLYDYEEAVQLHQLDTKVSWCNSCDGDWIKRTEDNDGLYCPNCSRTWNSSEELEEALFIFYCEKNNDSFIFCNICTEEAIQLIKEAESYYLQCSKCNSSWPNYEAFDQQTVQLSEVMMEEEQVEEDDYPVMKPTIDEIKKLGWDKYIITSF